MNDAAPKKRRRRRGGNRRKGKGNSPEVKETQQADKSSGSSGSKNPRGSRKRNAPQQPKRGRSSRSGKKTPELTFEEMIREFPPEYSSIPDFIKLCRNHRGGDSEFSEEEFFFFLATSVETLAEDKLDEKYASDYSEAFKEIRTREGLEENQYWKADDSTMPEDYRDLLAKFREEKKEVLARLFENFGEKETGQLVLENHSEYAAKVEQGRTAFYSRHKFDAVRMEPSEMNLDLQEEPANPPEQGSV